MSDPRADTSPDSGPDPLTEIKARRAELDGQIAPWARPYRADIDWLVGEVARLRDLLARLEWAGGHGHCPVCDASFSAEDGRHDPGCELAATLRNDSGDG